MRRGVIFDFDGTIALSEPVHGAAWRDTAEARGHRLPHGFEEYGIGRTDRELAERVASSWRATVDDILSEKRRFYLARCRTEAPLVAGIASFLRRLHGAALPLGVATSASVEDVTPTIQAHGLGRFFGAIMTVESVSRPKPDPEIYRRAADALGIDPAASFAFEDSPTGAAAARAAGLTVIGVTTTFEASALGPVVMAVRDYSDEDRLFALVGPIGA